jgi:glycosyltransferase involved in cell wall biosynthesis
MHGVTLRGIDAPLSCCAQIQSKRLTLERVIQIVRQASEDPPKVWSMAQLVSILIPCFNAERWIAQAIDSALAQTHAPREVIVVDDGSSDGSLEVIKRFGERVRFETGPNLGGNITRNRLLSLAKGEWVQYLDADDYLLPYKIERQMAFATIHPEAEIIYGPGIIFENWTQTAERQEVLAIPEPRDPWILLANRSLPQTGSPLWRKSAITDVGGWKPDQPCCQENELYLRLLMAGKRFAYCEDAGSVYRQWSEETLSRRDPRETTRRQLEVEERAEIFLAERGELTRARRDAINETRFAMARMAWHRAREEALAIVNLIRTSDAYFIPRGRSAPPAYRMLYRALGFAPAERVVDLRLKLKGRG